MDYQLIKPRLPELTAVEQVFYNRGFDFHQIQHYLNTTKSDVLPFDNITNLHKGVEMLIKHIKNKDKIFIQVDADCDGFTSSAFLINYLNRLFPASVQNYFTYRLHTEKEHGIIPKTIPDDVKLVIAPDSSSNQYEIHKELAEKGVDILIIDHHLTDRFSEYACVINNQICDYENKDLSGVGMVYKFCSYIDKLLNVRYADDYVDLVALGIIADIMSLTHYETRYLIEQGLEHIRNPFIQAMVQRQSFKLGEELTPHGVAFYIAPYINAVNRSGTPEERLLIFESMLEYRAYEQIPCTKRGAALGQMEMRVEQAVRVSNNVKRKQDKARDEYTEKVEKIIKDNNLLDHVALVVLLPKAQAANKGLTGLIAVKLANDYRHPTLILNETIHDGEVWWEGSGRGAPNIPITDARQMFLDTGLVEYAEGHDNAFGLGIKDCNINEFIKSIDTKYKDIDFTPYYFVDLEIDNELPNVDATVLDLAKLQKYWGKGIDEPLIAFKNVRACNNNVYLLKGSTLKIDFGNYNFIKLGNSSQEEYENLYQQFGFVDLTIIGTCAYNEWNGEITPQVKIIDYQIEKKQQFYF